MQVLRRETYKEARINILMFLEILLAIFLGVNAGIFTGLIPGLHVNLVTALLVGSVGVLTYIPLILVAVFIISLALTHSFLDSIPSIYLGAPDESQVIAALPGHQLLLEGKGHQAVLYTLIGSIGALTLTMFFVPLGLLFLPTIAQFLSPYIGKILLGIILLLILLSGKVLHNIIFFLFAGFLGLLCFSLVSQEQILLPLLSGLFGTSTLLISLTSLSTLPKQNVSKYLPLTRFDLERTISRATIVGILASFLPGFGSSQAAILASTTMKKKTPRDYLLLVGGINTVNFSFSIITLLVLGKARNGAILGVKDILGSLTINHLFLFIPVLFCVAGVALLLGIVISRFAAKSLQSLPYRTLVLSVILFVVIMVFILSSWQGLLILITATALGILASHFGAQKNMLLGCLLLPVMLYLW